jgi:nicotinate-nucleotide pyrophosphorylase (carboxylating)
MSLKCGSLRLPCIAHIWPRGKEDGTSLVTERRQEAAIQEFMNWDSPEIAQLIRAALDEDLGCGAADFPGDHTSDAIVAAGDIAVARIVAKQETIIAGVPLAERVFRALDADMEFEPGYDEGTRVTPGVVVLRLRGHGRAILTGERTALNFLAHLSGIATLTREFVKAIEGTRAQIRDTRKTTPLHRALEKYAVRVGGGVNHRFGLYDAILIKENHIAIAGSVTETIRRAHEHALQLAGSAQAISTYEAPGAPAKATLPIQVEVRNEMELREALAAGADSVLLDNTTPEQAAALTRIVRETRPECVVEISGGVNLGNVRAFAEAGVDFLAIGALTHSAPAADFTLLQERA